jgi:hypothetical protein
MKTGFVKQHLCHGSTNIHGHFAASAISERLGKHLATVATDQALIEAVAAEMSDGIACAVSFWMNQIEAVLLDPQLTTLGRMHAVQEIVKRYNSADKSGGCLDGYSA